MGSIRDFTPKPYLSDTRVNLSDPFMRGMVLDLPMLGDTAGYSAPITDDIKSLHDHSAGQLLTATVSNTGSAVNFDGYGMRVVSGTTSDRYGIPIEPLTSGFWKTFGDFTMMCRFQKLGEGDGGTTVFASDTFNNDGLGSGSRNTFLIRTANSANTRHVLCRANGTDIIDYSAVWAVGVVYTLAYTRTGTSNSLLLDGEVVATGTNSTPINIHRPTIFTHYQSGGFAEDAKCSLHYLNWWDRGMELDEIREFEANPWRRFEQPSRAKYFHADAVAATGVPPWVLSPQVLGVGHV